MYSHSLPLCVPVLYYGSRVSRAFPRFPGRLSRGLPQIPAAGRFSVELDGEWSVTNNQLYTQRADERTTARQPTRVHVCIFGPPICTGGGHTPPPNKIPFRAIFLWPSASARGAGVRHAFAGRPDRIAPAADP